MRFNLKMLINFNQSNEIPRPLGKLHACTEPIKSTVYEKGPVGSEVRAPAAVGADEVLARALMSSWPIRLRWTEHSMALLSRTWRQLQ